MKYLRLIVIVLVVVQLGACRKKGPTASQRIAAFNSAGRAGLEDGFFAAALKEFESSLQLDPNNLEAKVGSGWAIILLDDRDLEEAVAHFDITVTSDAKWQSDAWTGLSVIRLTQRIYAKADSLALLALGTDSSYVLLWKPDIDWNDLLVIQAQARYAQTLYDSSWVALWALLPGTPHESIDRNTPSTWMVDGITYVHFPMLLAELISYFSTLYRDQ